jgi:C-terminal processing protease CtpA/Prc
MKSRLQLCAWVTLLISALGLAAGCTSTHSSPPTKKPAIVSGVGLYLVRDEASGEFILRRTFPNSPAARANIPLNKILYRVNGTFVQPLHISEVSNLVKGPEGTKVFLEFVDPITREMTEVTVTRASFPNESR